MRRRIDARFVGLIILASSAVYAGPGPVGESLPEGQATAASDEMSPELNEQDLEKQLQAETEKLRQLHETLEAIENAPLPEEPAKNPETAESKPEPVEAFDIPEKPVAGAEEDFANVLFMVGEYERAKAVYDTILSGKPAPDRAAWAALQAGHCARLSGEYMDAVRAYESCMNEYGNSPWADEAAWWAGQVKWRLVIQETMRKEGETGRAKAAE